MVHYGDWIKGFDVSFDFISENVNILGKTKLSVSTGTQLPGGRLGPFDDSLSHNCLSL